MSANGVRTVADIIGRTAFHDLALARPYAFLYKPGFMIWARGAPFFCIQEF
jgi:hypothetical protein